MTDTQFEAKTGRRAQHEETLRSLPSAERTEGGLKEIDPKTFRKLVEDIFRALVAEGTITLTAADEMTHAGYSSEVLAIALVSTMGEVIANQLEEIADLRKTLVTTIRALAKERLLQEAAEDTQRMAAERRLEKAA